MADNSDNPDQKRGGWHRRLSGWATKLAERPKWLVRVGMWAWGVDAAERKATEEATKEATEKAKAADSDDEKDDADTVQDAERLKVTLKSGGVEVEVSGAEPSAGGDAEEEQAGDPLGSGILKVAGAVAAGITVTGAVVAVGAAVLWLRFSGAGIPAIQAISVQPKYEPLVLGGQTVVVLLGVALLAVLLIYFFDPGGIIRRITVGAFVALLALAWWYVSQTDLTGIFEFGSYLLALLLLIGCAIVGMRTETHFWPLALAMFLAAFIFSAATGLLIIKDQKFAQAVAVLRGDRDAGLTGLYVAATDTTLYVAQQVPIPTDKQGTEEGEEEKRAIVEVPREGAAYAVGPLDSIEHADERALELLEQLLANREREPPEPPPPAPAATPTGPSGPTGETEPSGATGPTGASGTTGATGSSETSDDAESAVDGSGPSSIETVAKAFGGSVTVHEKVARPWDCLVRYASAERSALGRWWTSCEEAKRLEGEGKTMLGIREALALPGRFQPIFDMRVKASLPPGKEVVYLEGEVAPQCEHDPPAACGHTYEGGSSRQIYLAKPEQVTVTDRQCTSAAQDEVPLEWGSCEPKPRNLPLP